MRFFTPDLFMRFNSSDDEVADRADEEWEAAARGYRDHLDRLRDAMPDRIRQLADLCLHDAELLATEITADSFPFAPDEYAGAWSSCAILSVKTGDEVVAMIYLLWDRLRRHDPTTGWSFSRDRPHWLYDEIDSAYDRPNLFLHRILWSDGSVMEIPFFSTLIHRIPLTTDLPDQASRQIA